MTRAETACLKAELEYRSWRECPQWYCVKTTLYNNGRITSEFVVDEKTKLPIIVQDEKKPQDGVYETMNAITYYTYHQGYGEAAEQIARAKKMKI